MADGSFLWGLIFALRVARINSVLTTRVSPDCGLSSNELASFAQPRVSFHSTSRFFCHLEGSHALWNRGAQNSVYIGLAIGMVKKIKRPEVQCCEIVSVFLRARWRANYDGWHFNGLLL